MLIFVLRADIVLKIVLNRAAPPTALDVKFCGRRKGFKRGQPQEICWASIADVLVVPQKHRSPKNVLTPKIWQKTCYKSIDFHAKKVLH